MNLGGFAGGLSQGLQNGMSLMRQKQQMDAETERSEQMKADRASKAAMNASIAAIPQLVPDAAGMAQYDARVAEVPMLNPVLDRPGYLPATSGNYASAQNTAVPMPVGTVPNQNYLSQVGAVMMANGEFGTGMQALQYQNVMANQDRNFQYQQGRDVVVDGRDMRDYEQKGARYVVADGQWEQTIALQRQKAEADAAEAQQRLALTRRGQDISASTARQGAAAQRALAMQTKPLAPYVDSTGRAVYPIVQYDRKGDVQVLELYGDNTVVPPRGRAQQVAIPVDGLSPVRGQPVLRNVGGASGGWEGTQPNAQLIQRNLRELKAAFPGKPAGWYDAAARDPTLR